MYGSNVIRKNTNRAKLIVAQMYNGTNGNVFRETKESLRMALHYLTKVLTHLEDEEQARINAALNPKRPSED